MFAASAVIFICMFCNLDIAVVAKGRIMGGKPANITDTPYQVALEAKVNGTDFFRFICGAVIIDKKWALTAAHCVEGETELRVRAGATNRQHGEIYNVRRYFMHDDYDNFTTDYDIALLKMDTPFRFSSSVQPIPLATKVPPPGFRATVSGWGNTPGSGGPAVMLQKVEVEILPDEKCDEVFAEQVTEHMLCAGFTRAYKNFCNGDSGGPLESGGKLVGLVSWSGRLCKGQAPGVYTNVAKLNNWIKAVKD